MYTNLDTGVYIYYFVVSVGPGYKESFVEEGTIVVIITKLCLLK